MKTDVRRISRIGRLLLLAFIVGALYFVGHDKSVYRIPGGSEKTSKGARAAPDQSLYPEYPAGSRVVVQDLSSDAPLHRGEDVVYAMSHDGKRVARFGRIFGLPGDQVGTKDGLMTVNGNRLALRGPAMGKVPAGHVLILATNPFEKVYPDSRKIGFVARSDVKAKLLFRLPF